VGPTAGLDDVEKRIFWTLPGLELQPLGHSARSQSLYRLSTGLLLLCGAYVPKELYRFYTIYMCLMW
jgi:hypothetical protein